MLPNIDLDCLERQEPEKAVEIVGRNSYGDVILIDNVTEYMISREEFESALSRIKTIEENVSNGGKSVLQGNLSVTGSTIDLVIDNILIQVTRLDSQTVGGLVRTISGDDVYLPVTRRLSPSTSNDSMFRKTLVVNNISQVLDSFQIGTYKISEYWITYGDKKYYIVAGSDELDDNTSPTLEKSWVEVYEGFSIQTPE